MKAKKKLPALKPCPFCGGKLTIERGCYSKKYWSECNSDGCPMSLQYGSFVQKLEAIAAANRRAGRKSNAK